MSNLLNPIFASEQETSNGSSATNTRRQPPLMTSSISLLPPEVLNARVDFSNQGLSDAEIRKRESAAAFSKFNFHPVPPVRPVRANNTVKRRLLHPISPQINNPNYNQSSSSLSPGHSLFNSVPIDQIATRNSKLNQMFATSTSNSQEPMKHPPYNYSLNSGKKFELALYSRDNLVVSAPTGAGKTVIFELSMINLLMQNIGAKMALCSERSRDWQTKFKTIGVSCGELTGDTNQAHINDIKRCDIIVTTPEKWDSMTRRWKDHGQLLELLKLFMIDEVHMLKEKRGATLEAVVSRMKTMGNDIRFVALSATVPNVDDVASWIGSNTGRSAKVLHFGEEYRPVRLVRHVLSFPMENCNAYMFDKKLDYKFFCATRKSAEAACSALLKQIQDSGHRLAIKPHSRIITNKDKKLQDLCKHGVAYHHAGLDTEDRKLVESTTSTLAVGVNLPAHLVIIKSTLTWNNQQYVEYSDLEILQMLGRAGRPQFDDSGVAVIMTSNEMKDKYENLVSGTELLESSLHENLTEHLNAEISLGTIHHINAAMAWLRSTFLYVRIKSNPTYYKMNTDEGGSELQHQDHQNFEKQLEEICAKDLDILNDSGMIIRSGDNLKITEYGEAMAKYYVKYKTMEEIAKLPSMASLCDILEMLSKAAEFSELRCHQGEKQVLNNLNKHPQIRFPLKGKVTRVDHKVYVMIQCTLGHIAFSDPKMGFQMNIDANIIFQHCPRIMNCIVECMVQKQDVITLRNAIDLARCLRAKTWENSPFILRQIDGIGPQYARHFANAGIQTFVELEKCDPRRIEMIVSRNPPFGNQIHDALASIPRFKLDISKYSEYNKPTEVELFVEISTINQKLKTNDNGMNMFSTFLAATSDNKFVDYRRFPVFKAQQGYKFRFKVNITKANQLIHCSVLLEDYVGLDVLQRVDPELDPTKLKFNNSIPAFLSQGSVGPPPNQAIFNETNNLFSNNNSEVLMLRDQNNMNIEYSSHNQDQNFDQIGGDSQDMEVMELDNNTNSNNDYNDSDLLPNGRFKCAHECCKVGCRHRPKKRKLQSASANTSTEIVNPEEKKVRSNNQNHVIPISSSSTNLNLVSTLPVDEEINKMDYDNTTANQGLVTSSKDENDELFDDFNDHSDSLNEQFFTSNDNNTKSISQASRSDNNPFQTSQSDNIFQATHETTAANLKRSTSSLPVEQSHPTNIPNFSSSKSFSFFDTRPLSITTITTQNSSQKDHQNNQRDNETASNSHIIDEYQKTALYSNDTKKLSEQRRPEITNLGHDVNPIPSSVSATRKEKSLVDESPNISNPHGGFDDDFLTWLNSNTVSSSTALSQGAKTTDKSHKQNEIPIENMTKADVQTSSSSRSMNNNKSSAVDDVLSIFEEILF
ncbi:10751_t:CDS:10 [Ambispora leptoticha]|uniref:DNA 3'-5' helicase n=1 Tax=Ambispora leptoticha TaxID=144679 RepID=A0A9N8YZB6_9GLOM|nr:10751_t:CDS:10 [Ambispora leptoticha]